jgi:glycosyltransferase involved in cell wall biosynthesis
MKQILPISIIIPIREAKEDSLNHLATAIYDQTAWPAEIIIVKADSEDSGIDEHFREKFDDPVRIKVFFAKDAYPGKARNVGVANATQPILAFLDLMTIPSPTWLKKSWELISQNNCDGLICGCKFIGENLFSWILIDALFGRGVISSFPGSLFTAKGFQKVGPMLDKTRAGEDNEWLQRAKLMEVEFYSDLKAPNCFYIGLQNITFLEFCKKWIRNYWNAATLPQYKLISQFNLFVWFAIAIGLAFNWNAFFAEWDRSHPLYLPHISKITFAALFLGYFSFRTLYLPIRRGSPLRQVLSHRILLIFLTATTADVIKSLTFLLRSLNPRHWTESA